jgi:Kef-type K+ transport system membrane component KefB
VVEALAVADAGGRFAGKAAVVAQVAHLVEQAGLQHRDGARLDPLMELVALNIGMDLGVLTPSMFTKLVIMALVSTFMATPLIRYLMRDQMRAPT